MSRKSKEIVEKNEKETLDDFTNDLIKCKFKNLIL